MKDMMMMMMMTVNIDFDVHLTTFKDDSCML